MEEKDFKKAIQKAEAFKEREELYFSPKFKKSNENLDNLKN